MPVTRLGTGGHASRELIGRSLGNALVAGDWEVPGMRARAELVVGRRACLRPLIAEILAAYPRPPVDRPREFAAFVAGSAVLGSALTRARRPIRVHQMPMFEAEMAFRRPWPVPVLHTEPALADLFGLDLDQLSWFADTKGMQRRAPAGPLHHYRYSWTVARSGRARLLEAPRPRLRAIQRTILDDILAVIPAHPAAHGFVAGRSAVSGARAHLGAATLISLDLCTFFTSLTAGRVYGVFRAAGYPQPVAHLLTGLCTTRTPVHVLRGSDEPSRQALREAHLPQGAPTSPALANLCVLRLDRRLAGYARACGMTYTRYADDLTFSGPASIRPDRVIHAVTGFVEAEGLRLQVTKTRVRRSFQHQSVTRIVVNRRLGIDRQEYDRLRAILHNCATTGPASQNHSGHADFRAHLLGRIAWVRQLDAGRAERLQSAFDRITW